MDPTALLLAVLLASAASGAGADGVTPPGTTPPNAAAAELVASDWSEAFVHANAAYEAGDHGRAIELYEALLAARGDSGHLLYNLGNAYLRSGALGRAVAAYRRSRALLPRDRDVAANLAFARRSTKDALPPPEPSPVFATLFFWHYSLSRAELLRLTVLFNLLFWCLLALRLYRRRSEALRWAAGAALALLAASGLSLAVRLAAPARLAVVLPQEVDARSGTGAASVVRFKLHAGSEVRLVERRDGWLRIGLPGGEEGWIEEQYAATVTL